jgi:hypothetical protein
MSSSVRWSRQTSSASASIAWSVARRSCRGRSQTLGSQSAAAGSLHCDVWGGPAAELAQRGLLAIYPVSGWWRYRTHLNRCNSRGRYGLVVSITAHEAEVELYTEIANLIGLGIETEIST